MQYHELTESFQEAQFDGRCALKINKNKIIPYTKDGFTLRTKSMITDENVNYAIALAYRGYTYTRQFAKALAYIVLTKHRGLPRQFFNISFSFYQMR